MCVWDKYDDSIYQNFVCEEGWMYYVIKFEDEYIDIYIFFFDRMKTNNWYNILPLYITPVFSPILTFGLKTIFETTIYVIKISWFDIFSMSMDENRWNDSPVVTICYYQLYSPFVGEFRIHLTPHF